MTAKKYVGWIGLLGYQVHIKSYWQDGQKLKTPGYLARSFYVSVGIPV